MPCKYLSIAAFASLFASSASHSSNASRPLTLAQNRSENCGPDKYKRIFSFMYASAFNRFSLASVSLASCLIVSSSRIKYSNFFLYSSLLDSCAIAVSTDTCVTTSSGKLAKVSVMSFNVAVCVSSSFACVIKNARLRINRELGKLFCNDNSSQSFSCLSNSFLSSSHRIPRVLAADFNSSSDKPSTPSN